MEYLARIKTLEEALKEKTDTIRYLENLSEVHSNIILLANEERIEAEKMIHAHENIHGIGKLMLEADLSSPPSGTIEMKQPVSSLVENGLVLDQLVSSLASNFSLNRFILFLKDKNKLISRYYFNINVEETRKKYFEEALTLIRDSINKRASIILKNHTIELETGTKSAAMACIPLVFKSSLLGVIYGDSLA